MLLLTNKRCFRCFLRRRPRRSRSKLDRKSPQKGLFYKSQRTRLRRGIKIKKTRDATAILNRRLEKSPTLKQMVEEERVNYQAALEIRQARKKAGLTQAELAREIGTTQSVIARLEGADYQGHTLKMLEHIAEALGRRVEIHLRPAARLGAHLYAP